METTHLIIVIVPVWVGKEFPDMRQNEREINFLEWENSRDRRAWWAAVYGVAQSRTRLKRLSSSRSRSIKELGKGRGTCRQAGHFPGGLVNEESAYNSGELGLIPGLGRFSGEGNGYPLQYSCLENSMDRVAWWATVHEVTKSWTRLSA